MYKSHTAESAVKSINSTTLFSFRFYVFADSEHCRDLDEIGSSMCFSIQIPADIDHNDVESAELWVYKEPHVMDTNKHSFLIGEVETWDSEGKLHNMHCRHIHTEQLSK